MTIELAEPVPPNPVAEEEMVARRGGWIRATWRSRNGRIGIIVVALVVIGAVCGIAGWTPYPADAQNPNAVLKGISWAHLMGTDQFGRDVFSGALQGLGVSLEIAALAVAISGVIGSLGGIAAGFLGKWTSASIMRVTDMMFAIPTVLFALAIVTALGPSILDSSIAIGVGWVPIYVRVVRTPVLALRESDFVRAGRVLGYSRTRLLFHHILPNVTGVIAVQTSLALAWAILAEASLSFLGLGPPPPTQSLGEMVSNSSSLAAIAWWTLAGPSLVIVIAVIGFNFLGDGLRDASDPRTRTRSG
ncbi:MAG: ABC transporter permease [Acidimicrobiales bacterium]|jgi:peptide/nickel transport system permease protein